MTTPHTLASVMPAPRRSRAPWFIAGAVALVLVAAGVTYLLWPKRIHITGTVVLNTGSLVTIEHTCDGARPYEDVHAGAQVVITDGTGATIALGTLGAGRVLTAYECRFPLTADAPAGKGIYGVTVGKRPGVQYPEDRLSQPLTLTLGDGS